MEKPSILVVDDDDITRSFLFDILVHEGYEVSTAENGVRALEVLKSQVPDIIISDVMMPELNGLELFRKIQEDERLQDLPFIFLTALDDGDVLIRMKELGPDDYLNKPVRPRHLLATVKGKLRRKQRLVEKVEREQSRMRERIRWTLSHELRTPLTIIQGISELLLSEGGSQGAGDDQDLLQSLRSQSLQLGTIIENFLLVTRIDSGVEEENWRKGAGPQSLEEMVQEASLPFYDRARARAVEYQIALPPDLSPAHVHRPHVLEILKQVLDNAFKFADPKTPRVALSAALEGESLRIVIENNGASIPAEKQSVLFQKLSQVDREIHEQQGSGLGLYLVKRLVDLNGGAIELESQPGQGVKVTIRLPTKAVPASVPGMATPPIPPAA